VAREGELGELLSVQGLQEGAGLPCGRTIQPRTVIVGGGSGVAFLGDLVHAGAANDWPCPHYRLHCYYMANGPGAEKRDNAASLLPVVVAGVYEGCVRMFRK